jgi:hypothetical protein
MVVYARVHAKTSLGLGSSKSRDRTTVRVCLALRENTVCVQAALSFFATQVAVRTLPGLRAAVPFLLSIAFFRAGSIAAASPIMIVSARPRTTEACSSSLLDDDNLDDETDERDGCSMNRKWVRRIDGAWRNCFSSLGHSFE